MPAREGASAIARFPRRAASALADLSGRPCQIGEIGVGHLEMERREHEMKPRRLRRQAGEPAALEQLAPNGHRVDFVMGEGDDPELRTAKHAKAERLHARLDLLACIY